VSQSRATTVWTTLFLLGVAGLLVHGVRTGAGSRYVREVEVVSPDGTQKWTRAYAAPPRESRTDPAVKLSGPRTIGVWISGFLTLATFSLLYRDNVWFKFAQSLVVGVAAGFAVVTGFWTMLVPNLYAKLAPAWARATTSPGLSAGDTTDWWALVPLALSIMLVWRLAPRGGWISRWPLAFFIGLTAGLQLVTIFKSDFVDQINNTLLPLAVFGPQGFDAWKTLRNVLVVGGVLSALTYFFFSVEQKGWLGRVASVGIAVLMITFGASFGMTVMGRISLLAARIQFVLDDWLWLIDPLGNRAGM
jgi:hypothetical protein